MRRSWSWRFAFLTDKNLSVALLDVPARNVVESGGANRGPGAKIKTRVMPRTSNRVSDDETFRERATVVRTIRSDREKFFSVPHEQNGFAVCLPQKTGAIIQLLAGNSSSEIGSVQFVAFQFFLSE